MSTQYNAIQRPYDELRKKTISLVERANVRSLVMPFIHNATVLDLACGSGFYSHHFVKWGARKVIGVDISSAMIEEARVVASGNSAEFIEANCDKPTTYPGGPFDLVFGAWYLNYAATGSALVEMFRNVLLNLKPGGRLVAVTPPPTNDPAEYIRRECELRPLPTASGGLYTTINKEVADGLYAHYHSATPAGDLDFDTYHLRKEVWEVAAREAGFQEPIQWGVTQIPSDFMIDPIKYGEEHNGGAGEAELASYSDTPHYGLLMLRKQE
ncbi:hypothetical protein PRZ48_003894 [Zasmidium cellare]|uniref:Methyltransferase domain-containing protein n=1 Tax=Zasmidium cellare TaxID=395010 RepID=A0ABR0EWC5_ZASCE|nr:hypothetical protein PRZ48_003894 [Zasmidium cellare]